MSGKSTFALVPLIVFFVLFPLFAFLQNNFREALPTAGGVLLFMVVSVLIYTFLAKDQEVHHSD